MLQFVSKITDDSKKDMLLKVVSDKYCRIILYSVIDKSKSVTEVAVETGISVSIIYRIIQVLCDSKLLAISGTISKDGKKSFLYKSKIRSIQILFNDGKLDIKSIPN
jgi:predicted transcriptional regulator